MTDPRVHPRFELIGHHLAHVGIEHLDVMFLNVSPTRGVFQVFGYRHREVQHVGSASGFQGFNAIADVSLYLGE
jgi:hypothetical protein